MDPNTVLQSNTNYVDTYVVRGALLWQPMASLTITPSVFYQNRHQNNIDDYWVGISNPGSRRLQDGTPENMGDRDHFVLPALKVDYDLGVARTDLQHLLFRSPRARAGLQRHALRSLLFPAIGRDCGLNPDFVTPCIGGLCGALLDEPSTSPRC